MRTHALAHAYTYTHTQVLNPDMLRKMLKTAFQPVAVSNAIKAAMKKMPAELQHPFEDFLTFANELDEADLDAIVGYLPSRDLACCSAFVLLQCSCPEIHRFVWCTLI